MFNKTTLVLILALSALSCAFAGQILPDSQFPVILGNPHLKNDQTDTLTLQFSLDSDLPMGNYIAVEFPKTQATVDLGATIFKFDVAGSASCAIHKDASTQISATWTASAAVDGQKNIFYCKVNDTLTKGQSYRLVVGLLAPATQKNVNGPWGNINVYTKTAATANGIVLHCAAGFGNVNVFKAMVASENEIISMSADPTSDVTSMTHYDSFKLTVKIKVKAITLVRNALLAVEFPTSSILSTMPTSVSFEAIDATKPIQDKIAGTPKLVVDGNIAWVSGWTDEYWVTDREFSLVFSGCQAGETASTTSTLVIKLYYPNSNVVQSYSTKAFPAIGAITMTTFTAAHPEGWDIYMSGAWPIKFTYEPSKAIAPTSGTYVVIQHSNMYKGSNVFNFVASTCDFSQTSDFATGWGARNNCYSLQASDLNFAGITALATADAPAGKLDTGTGINGSGIFFKQDKIDKKLYTLIVWGVADLCGLMDPVKTDASVADPLVANSSGLSVGIKFKIYVYNSIVQTNRPGQLFSGKTSLTVAKESAAAVKCYSVYRGITQTTASPNAIAKGWDFELYGFIGNDGYSKEAPCKISDVAVTTVELTVSNKYDTVMYKEFVDPVIIGAPETEPSALSTTDYSLNLGAADTTANSELNHQYGFVSTSSKGVQPNFLFPKTAGTNSALGKAVLIRGDAAIVTQNASTVATSDSKHAIPSPVISTAGNTGTPAMAAIWAQIGGQLEIYFSSNWFEANKADTTCGISWQVGVPAEENADASYKGTRAANSVTTVVATTAADNLTGNLFTVFPLEKIADTTALTLAAANTTGWVLKTFTYNGTVDVSYQLLNYYLSKAGTTNISTFTVTATSIVFKSLSQTGGSSIGGSKFTWNPSSLGYTTYVPAVTIGIAAPAIAASSKAGVVCGTTIALACNITFNLYTNCLKWKATVTDKTLFSSFDVIFRHMPSVASSVKADPHRVIRFVKLFPEAQGFQEVTKRVGTGTTAYVTFHYSLVGPESETATYSTNTTTAACVVQIAYAGLTDIMTANTAGNTIAIFLHNIALLDTDASDPKSTYPIGSLDGAIAYGLQSAPTISNASILGGLQIDQASYIATATFVKYQSVNWGVNAMRHYGMPFANQNMKGWLINQNINMGSTQGRKTSSWGRSTYHFLLGSVVLVTGVKSNSNPIKNATATSGQQDMFIPTRCPNASNGTTDGGDAAYYASTWDVPSAYIVALKATDYKTFEDVTGVLRFQGGPAETDSYQTVHLGTAKAAITNGRSITASNEFYVAATVQFYDYENTGTNFENSFELSTTATVAANDCTAYVVFSQNTLKVASVGVGIGANTVATATNVMSNYQSTQNLYVFGTTFNNVFALNYSTAWTSNALPFSGLARPATLADFKVGTAATTQGLIAVSCNASAADKHVKNAVSTVTRSATAYTVSGRIVTKTLTSGGTLKVEANGTLYKTDTASSLKYTFGFGTKYAAFPATASFVVATNMITAASQCAIDNGTGNPIDCTIAAGSATCGAGSARSGDLVMYCFGITLGASTLDSAKASISGVLTSGTGNIIITYQPSTGIASPYDATTATDVTTKVAELLTPDYNPKQELGLGRVRLQVKLPRPFIRDGKIVFQGTFPFATANTPKTGVNCDAYFGTANDALNGNALIESVDCSSLDGTSNSIVLITKKLVYQIAYKFSDTINFELHPVELAKIDITKKFQVQGLGVGGSSASGALFASTDVDYSKSESYLNGLSAKPTATFIKDNLCKLAYKDVYPRVPGGLSDFTFTFDLSTEANQTGIGTKTINRFTIWWPRAYFGDYANSADAVQMCSVAGKRVQCKFDNRGQLVIRTNGTKGTNLVVTVHSVRVGYIESDLSFFCSVDNETDATAMTFTNILTGSGKMLASDPATDGITGIQQVAVTANTWNLRIIPATKAQRLTNAAPRSTSNLKLNVVVDQHSAWISQADVQIKGSPVVHVFLPQDFKLNWFRWIDSGFKPVMKIENVTGKIDATTKVALTTTAVDVTETTFSGNRISGVLKNDLVLTTEHKYLTITIEGLRNPLMDGNTGALDVVITTKKYDYLARTHSNSMGGGLTDVAYTYTIMPKPTSGLLTNGLYIYSRGAAISKGNLWDQNVNGTNMCNANAGKYVAQTLNVSGVNAAQAVADIALTDSTSTFSFPPNAKYTLKTADGKIEFKMGATCTAIVGTYLVSVGATGAEFLPVSICWTNLTQSKATIKFAFDGDATTCIKGGSLPATYTLAEANVDEIKVDKWTGKTGNDATASIAAVVIAPNTLVAKTQFAITNAAISTVQKFDLTFTNACWTITPVSAEVTPSIEPPAISTLDVKPWIVCTNPATDTTLALKLNSIHCTITPTLFPLNMYCAVVCKTAADPADAEIVALKLTNDNKYLNQVAGWYFSKAEKYELYFNGLARGRAYKVKCIFKTTQADAAAQQTATATISSTKNAADAVIDIQTPDVDGTACMTFVMEVQLSATLQSAILSALQTLFPSGSAGCVSLTYNVTANGVTTPQYVPGFAVLAANLVSCPAAAARLRQLRSRDLTTTPAATPAATPATPAASTPATPATPPPTFPFTICAVQGPVCPTNPSASRRLRYLTTPPATPPASTPATPATPPSALKARLTVIQTTQAKDGAALAALAGGAAAAELSKLKFTVQVISDDAAPVLKVTYTGTSYDASTKKAKATIAYTDAVELKCYYQISATATKPTAANIQACTTANTCGNFMLKQPSYAIDADISSLAIGTAYSIWYSCFNNVPNASKGSIVASAFDFTTNCPTGTTLSGGSCATPPPPPVASTSSNFVLMSIASLLAVMMIMFN